MSFVHTLVSLIITLEIPPSPTPNIDAEENRIVAIMPSARTPSIGTWRTLAPEIRP